MESAEIERELEELETRVERLRGLYEQYFMGIEKTEPQIPRKDVERRVWILRREQIRNTGLRFKFQMIVQRFNTFQQYWARVAREIENGTYRRDVMRAAARFGEKDALTVLGKKRADQYRTLIENQKKLRESGRKAIAAAIGEPSDERAAPPPEASGPGWGDITEVMDPNDVPIPDAVADDLTPSPEPSSAPVRGAPPLPTAAQPNKQNAGLRWSLGAPRAPAATPSEPTVVRAPSSSEQTSVNVAPPAAPRNRIAELAAEMRAKKNEQKDAGPSGLDLDFDADMTLPAPTGGGPPKRRRSSKSMKAVRLDPQPVAPPRAPTPHAAPSEPTAPNRAPPLPAAAFKPVVVAPNPPAIAAKPAAVAAPPAIAKPPPPLPRPIVAPTISEAEGPWNEATQLSTRRKLAAAQGAEVKPTAASPPAAPAAAPAPTAPARAAPPVRTPMRPVPAPRSSEPTAAEPAAKRTPEELTDQRIRQIYAKYVEKKRDANESTAGVTYERLAQSLRAQADKLRSSHPTKTVDYEVVTKDGKTMLKPILR